MGEKGELGSRAIRKELGFSPRKSDLRLNHHYELISKRKITESSKPDWIWRLNEIGNWIFKNLLQDRNNFGKFMEIEKCPLCQDPLFVKLRNNWRSNDFEGDIFWDIVRKKKYHDVESKVYDIVLPSKPKKRSSICM
ncbi:hypothetical protein ES705_49075 [subsurface metagenome]